MKSRFKNLVVHSLALLGAAAFFPAASTQAATGTWQNSGSNWTTNANWTGATYPGTSAADNATLAAAATVLTPDLASSITINTLTIDNSGTGGSYSITTGNASVLSIGGTANSIVITGGGTTNIAPQVNLSGARAINNGTTALNFNGGIGLNATTPSLTLTNSTAITTSAITTVNGPGGNDALSFDGTGSMTVTGSIAPGSGKNTISLTSQKSYTGTLTLSGANTFSTATVWRAGTLQIGNDAALGGQAISLGSITAGAEAVNLLTTGAFTTGSSISFNNATLVNTSFTVGGAQTSGTSTYSGTVNMTNLRPGNNGLKLTSASGGTVVFSGVISGSTAANCFITKVGDGTVVLSNTNTYAGTTTVSAGTLLVSGGGLTTTSGLAVGGGTLQLGASNVLNNAAALTLSGGAFSTGATAGFSETLGTLDLNTAATLTLALGTGVHSLNFADSHLIDWTGSTLTITGWTGTAGFSGTSGRIFFGSSIAGLSTAQLSQINFSGYSNGATILSSGEIVAIPEPATWALLAFSLMVVTIQLRRRLVLLFGNAL